MKKIVSLVFAMIIVVSLAACTVGNVPNETTVPTEATVLTSQSTEQTSPIPGTALSNYAYQFDYGYTIRLQSWLGETENPNVRIIFSVNELTLPTVYGDTDVQEIYAKFDEDFFKENFLVVYELHFGSGSVTPTLMGVQIQKGEKITITNKSFTPEVMTCDMASWIILVPISRADADGTEKIVLS